LAQNSYHKRPKRAGYLLEIKESQAQRGHGLGIANAELSQLSRIPLLAKAISKRLTKFYSDKEIMESQTQKQRPKRLEICGIKSLEYLLF